MSELSFGSPPSTAPWRQVGAALLAVLAVLAGTFLPPPLQDQITVWQVVWLVLLFLALAWVPGYLLDERLHLSGEEVTPASPAVWLALSCGLLAPAGWLVLGLHTPLWVFGMLTAGIILLLLLPHLITRAPARPFVWPFGRRDRRWLALAGVLIILLLALTAWAPENADNWSYNAYIFEYVATDAVNAAHPSFGQGIPDNPRMSYNVWLVFQAFLARGVGLHPGYVFAEPFKLLMALMAVTAAYTLAVALFRTPARALHAVVIFLAALFLMPGFREPGAEVMTTINYDKYTAAFVLMPVGWFLVLRLLEGAGWRDYAGLFVLGAGLAAVHAEVLMLVVISFGFLLVALFLMRHPFVRLKRTAGAIASLLPWTGFVFATAWMYTQRGPAPGSEAWELLHQANLAQGRIRFLGSSQWFIVEPTLVFYPLLIISLLLTPFLLTRGLRTRPAAALLVGNQFGPLVLMFLPGLPNLMSMFTEYNTLWRIGWLFMPAFTIAYVVDAYEDVWSPWWQKTAHGFRRALPSPLRYAGLALIGVVLLAGMAWNTVTTIQREIVGRPARQWIPSPGLYETLAPLEPAVNAMGAPLVLASAGEIMEVTSIWPFARVASTRGVRGTLPSFPPDRQEEALARIRLVESLGAVEPWDKEWLNALRELGVDLLVVNRQNLPAFETNLERLPAMFLRLAQSSTHSVYLVVRDPFVPLGMVAEAQAALLRGETTEACRLFRDAHARFPDFALVTAGAAWCAEQAGDKATARDLYLLAKDQVNNASGLILDSVPALKYWTAHFPLRAMDANEPLLASTESFVAERLSALEFGADEALVGMPAEWVQGWPRQAARASTGTLSHVALPFRLSSPTRLTLRAEGTLTETVLCALLGQRSDGDLRLWASHSLYPEQERVVELPALPDERLWLQAGGTDPSGECIAYGWHAVQSDEAELASAEAAALASRLMADLPGMGIRPAEALARTLFQQGPPEDGLQAVLAGLNLVRDADFMQGEAGPWQAMAPGPAARFFFAPDGGDDLVAVVEGEEAGYHGGWCQTLGVSARGRYLYLVRLSARLEIGGKALAGYWDYRRLGRFRTGTAQVLRQSADWTVVAVVIEVPAGVRSLSICPALLSGPGEVRVDWAWFLPADRLR